MTTFKSEQIQLTEPVQIVWVNLVRPRPERKIAGGGTAASRYEISMLFPKDHPDLPRIKSELGRVMKEGGLQQGAKLPIQRGETIADDPKADGKREWARGFDVLKARANVKTADGELLTPPRLKVVINQKVVNYSDEEQRALAKKYFYSGVLTIPTLTFVPYSGMGGSVACYVNEVLSLNSGTKIVTGVDDDERYKEVIGKHVGRASTVDATAGADIDY